DRPAQRPLEDRPPEAEEDELLVPGLARPAGHVLRHVLLLHALGQELPEDIRGALTQDHAPPCQGRVEVAELRHPWPTPRLPPRPQGGGGARLGVASKARPVGPPRLAPPPRPPPAPPPADDRHASHSARSSAAGDHSLPRAAGATLALRSPLGLTHRVRRAA